MYDLTVDGNESKLFTTEDMKVGDIGEITGNGSVYDGHRVLCVHRGLVSLTDPGIVWIDDRPKFLIRLLKLGQVIKLTIK